MFLALKKVPIVKITPHQVLSPGKRNLSPIKISDDPLPPLTAIWKTLVVVIGKVANCELKQENSEEGLEIVAEVSELLLFIVKKHVCDVKNNLGKLFFLDPMSWILHHFLHD